MEINELDPMSIRDDHFGVQKNKEGYINPFCQDAFHMGVHIGKNVTIMMANHDSEVCKSFIIVNTKTGKRTQIAFDLTEI